MNDLNIKSDEWIEIAQLEHDVYNYKMINNNPTINGESPKAVKLFTVDMDKVHQDAVKLYQMWIPKSQLRYDTKKKLWVASWWLERNGIRKV